MYASVLFNSTDLKYRILRKCIAIKNELLSSVNEHPIFILGNQKSGTSAIALLLADAVKQSVTIDLRKEIWKPTFQMVNRSMTFDQFLSGNRADFSNDIVKEPNLTLLYYQLVERFPEAKFIFVVRDPRDNIRSILDRLKLKGDQDQAPDHVREKISRAWSYVLNSHWCLETSNALSHDSSYVEHLAARWDFMGDIYFRNDSNIVLLKYEDFCLDKKSSIEKLAHAMAVPVKQDVSAFVDMQFQPPGSKNADLSIFFGDNYAKIKNICQKNMTRFGYVW